MEPILKNGGPRMRRRDFNVAVNVVEEPARIQVS
jgi:hypothetical protein